MGNLLLQVAMHPLLWRILGRVVLGAGGMIGLLAWRVGRMQGRVDRRISHFNINIEANIANALPDWLFVFMPQTTLGWCMWVAWMACGFYFLNFAKKLKQY